MPSPKQRRIPEKPTAVPRTETARVDHPRLAGLTESVVRVTDTLAAMFKRKQISEREYMTAERIRMAQERLYGAVGGVMDMDRARGGSTPGQPPALGYMIAAETMSEIRRFLYPQDYAVVHRVCGLGMTVEEAAANLYAAVPTRAQKEDCGRRLRAGLEEMARRWFPDNKGQGHRMRSHVSERAGVTDVESVPVASSVAHATRDRVFRGEK